MVHNKEYPIIDWSNKISETESSKLVKSSAVYKMFAGEYIFALSISFGIGSTSFFLLFDRSTDCIFSHVRTQYLKLKNIDTNDHQLLKNGIMLKRMERFRFANR